MTIWSPRLTETAGTALYHRIADAVERDVRAGVLLAGSQLPTHRRLARDLGITPVTVTRAYAEAARRGLVETTTGRGTFVRNVRREAAVAVETDLATNVVNVELPSPSRALLERVGDLVTTGSYATGAGLERHRAAGAAWIGRRTDPSRVLVTAGTQHALLLALSATTRPGDVVLCEALAYHGVKAVASMLNVRLEPLPLDRYGIVPDAFARAARARVAKVLYLVPSLHNPTGIVVPEKRRRELAAIADKHGITIVEDDVCGFLLEKTPPPLAAFAPDRTIFITGLGKAIAPALRIGFLTAPDALLARAQASLAATMLFTSPALAEIAATWIEDGTAARIVARKREEVALRNRVTRRILPRVSGDPRSAHVWLELPGGRASRTPTAGLPARRQSGASWTGDTFADEARRRRVRVAAASSFAIGDDVPRAVRLSIGVPATVAELESALHVIAGIDEERMQEPVI